MTQMEKRIKVVICNDIFPSRLTINRKHHVGDFIAEQPVFQMSIKRSITRVIFNRVGRSLLEINRKQREPPPDRFGLAWPARETEKLKKLPAILLPETVESQNR